MELTASFANLASAHPNLLWRDIRLAAVAVLSDQHRKAPFFFELSVREVPGFDDDVLRMNIDGGKLRGADLVRVRRTYEHATLVEFAAIAIAGLGLYHAGDHRIQDVAWRGSSADYLVGEEGYPLEIAGRSRRIDLEPAWRDKWRRLSKNAGRDFFVCVAEFETLTGRLAFKH